jgi:hypothetical protein
MVKSISDAALVLAAPLAQLTDKAVLDRVDPPTRAAIIMTVLGLVLTGIALIAAAMVGSHWVRRLARQRPRNSATSGDAIANLKNAQLRASLKGVRPTADTACTVQIDPAESDTKVD